MLRRIKRRRELSVALLVTVLVVSIVGNALFFYLFERDAYSGLTVWDSLWYSVISISTIGYGDYSATTIGARIGTAVFIIIIGLATFTAAVGMTVDWIVDLRQKERTGMATTRATNHALIVNFPSESRVRQIIDQFTQDANYRDREIVVVTDQIETLPFDHINVSFVKGSPLETETFERANLARAGDAIVLSPDYRDPRSDSYVASIAFVIEHMNPRVEIIAECLDPKHAVLFTASENVSLVYTMRIATNLLVQEAQDPGVNLLANAITSNEIEGTLASTTVESLPDGLSRYTDVAKKLLDKDVNLVGVIRGDKVIVSLGGAVPVEGDSLVYVSGDRHSWSSLQSLLA